MDKQRVAVARGLVADPIVLLADEPTANLDHISAESVVELLRRLRERGRTIIISTHDDRLLPAVDQVVEMHPDHPLPSVELAEVSLAPGEVLFRQSSPSDYVYAILEGTVEVVREYADGNEAVIATRDAGAYIGELGPMLDFPRSATVRARDRVRLMPLDVHQYMNTPPCPQPSPTRTTNQFDRPSQGSPLTELLCHSARMGAVQFTVVHDFEASAKEVWDELVDWAGHARWIPATRVEVAPGDPLAIGAEFTAWTGIGPLALKDRMRLTHIEWQTDERRGECMVDKLGPVLLGTAGFTVAEHRGGARLTWIEDVTVKFMPRLFAPIAAKIGAAGFSFGMRNLARQMRTRDGTSRSR